MTFVPKQRHDLGFDLSPNGVRAIFRCAKCGATLSVAAGTARLAPEHVAKRASRSGWKTDAFAKSVCRCPRCLAHVANDPDSEIKKFKGTTMNPISPTTLQEAAAQVLASKQALNPVIISARVPLPTNSQRHAIRALLDKHFDDSTGSYLDGKSDLIVAQTANVPRVVVEKIREAAYGAIRFDPEIDDLKKGLAALLKDAEAAQGTLNRAQESIHAVQTLLTDLMESRAALVTRANKLEARSFD